ncbi:hypothetical protein RB10752 [Rhodopirellula baltica SH 1]|uniref:Uncharacterized protein n=1 Tax=Rhodopirellula baltica (strain DSM 10527 / NCIMB 13988 / SH1) TaxID=243090 RepID=Q7UKA7_RHOBA|nr:hypothetical protein RB10752 [Rhodopirellula baltica SH 1]
MNKYGPSMSECFIRIQIRIALSRGLRHPFRAAAFQPACFDHP